jgi:hypothetical protein
MAGNALHAIMPRRGRQWQAIVHHWQAAHGKVAGYDLVSGRLKRYDRSYTNTARKKLLRKRIFTKGVR